MGLETTRSTWTSSGLYERGLFFSFVHRTQQGLNALKTEGELLSPQKTIALGIILGCQHHEMPIIHSENSRRVSERPDAQ